MKQLSRSVIITGIKHCGKSSTARMLSSHFQTPFVDIDDKAEEVFSAETGEALSVREIYKRGGRDLFMKYELKAAEYLNNKSALSPVIAAAGGGICDNNTAVDILLNNFIFIYIEEDSDVLYERIIKNGIPPFLSADDPYNNFSDLYQKRSAIYKKICNIIIVAEGRSTAAIGREIINRLLEEDYAG